MKTLRAAVIGAGHLGRYHAEKYRQDRNAELFAVVDVDPDRARQIAERNGAAACTSHHEVIGKVDVASVVVPTDHHHAVVRDLLEAGIHVLVEKPFTATLAEGLELKELAEARGCILQVGHIEQYNAVTQELQARLRQPMFIEAKRISPFQLRGTEVSVVLDLMIHDIDLIRSLVRHPVRQIQASGGAVLSPHVDIVNARIEFSNGCVGNVTASRISHKCERSMRIFEPDSYLSADFQGQSLQIYRKNPRQGQPGTHAEVVKIASRDALAAEIADFLDCVRQQRQPRVGASEGIEALRIAFDILRQLEENPLPGQSQALHSAESAP